MKRIVLLMGFAVLAFTSCVKDTVKEVNNGQAIDFRIAAETRATEVTTDNLTAFAVTAISATDAGVESTNYFENQIFAKNSEDYFMSSPAYYWPNAGELHFYAWAPCGEEGIELELSSTSKTVNLVMGEEIADHYDFLVAKAEGNKEDNESSGVHLTFEHMFSQIQVKAKNTHPGYRYSIIGVKLTGIDTDAVFDFGATDPEDAWELNRQYGVCITRYEDTPITVGSTPTSIMTNETVGGSAMVIPQDLSGIEASIEILANVVSLSYDAEGEALEGYQVFPGSGVADFTTEEGVNYAWMSIPVTTKWEPGYRYVYTLDLTSGVLIGEPIKFTMDVIPWSEQDIINDKEVDLTGTWNMTKVEVVPNNGETTTYEGHEEIRSSGRVSDYHLTIKVADNNRYYIYPGQERQRYFQYMIEDFMLRVEVSENYYSDYVIETLTEESVIYKIVYDDQFVRFYYEKIEDIPLRPEE